MTELEKKEISEIVIDTLKSFLEGIKPMPVPVLANPMGTMYYLSCCTQPPPPCCCTFPPRHLSTGARTIVNDISTKIKMSEEEVMGIVEQRLRKRQLLSGINGLATDLNLNPVEISNSLVFMEISDKIKEIISKTGLNEEDILNLAEQRIRKDSVEEEIMSFNSELQ
jgi:hypothetical protein